MRNIDRKTELFPGFQFCLAFCSMPHGSHIDLILCYSLMDIMPAIEEMWLFSFSPNLKFRHSMEKTVISSRLIHMSLIRLIHYELRLKSDVASSLL